MLLCAVMVVSRVAMGTIAYLTASTSVTNTFTVGNVYIVVEETDVNEDGEPVDGEGNVLPDGGGVGHNKEGNEYRLVPGRNYVKAPTVTIKAESEESYVRMLVAISDINDVKTNLKATTGEDFMHGEYVEGYEDNKWLYVGETVDANDSNIAIYEFRYHETVSTLDKETRALDPLFKIFTVPGKLNNAQLNAIREMEIQVYGQAIQAATF